MGLPFGQPKYCLGCEYKKDYNKLVIKMEQDSSSWDAPVVGLKAMERARSTLEDFCRSYFMFHDMDDGNPQHVFKYLPVLMFVEAYIYQLDQINEDMLSPSLELAKARTPVGQVGVGSFRPLCQELSKRGLLTERIEEELKNGEEYWLLEQYLCKALPNNTEVDVSQVMRAIHLKSFDYRVLNLLLYHLTGKPVNELHFSFLAHSEFLVEIADDLYDYEEDVVDNTFNFLRMLIRIYGPKETPVMLAKCIAEAEEKYQVLLQRLEPGLAAKYQERCKAAVSDGGDKSKHPLGSWTVPRLIVDEELYRSQIGSASTAAHGGSGTDRPTSPQY